MGLHQLAILAQITLLVAGVKMAEGSFLTDGAESYGGEASAVDGTHWHSGSKKWWLQHLGETPSWTVTPEIQGVKGAYVAADSQSFACFLLLQNVCHTDVEGHRFGGWYSPSGEDIARTVTLDDVCGHRSRTKPPEFPNVWHKTNIERVGAKMGFLLQEKPKPEAQSEHAPPSQWFDRTVVAPHDAYIGHLVERIGSWGELSENMRRALGGAGSTEQFPLPNMTVTFGSSLVSKGVPTFAGNMSQIFFGRDALMLAGRNRTDGDMCFKEAIFMLNWVYTRESTARVRERVYAAADKEFGTEGPRNHQVQEPYQVSWAWRSGSRHIVNRGAVAELLMTHFKGLPLELVEHARGDSFFKMVERMRRTAFFFGMHGGAFSNIFLLPANATVLEILPYKFSYVPFRMIGKLYGLKYHQWRNDIIENHAVDNDCFQPYWKTFTVEQCSAEMACYQCVKNHSVTTVDIDQLREVLAEISVGVKEWVASS